jgi:electron transport complex protein RnfD
MSTTDRAMPAARRARGLAARNALLVAALLPGIVTQAWLGDIGLPLRLALAAAAALAFEAIALRLRAQPLSAFLGEGSALVTAVLLALWLPALDGWRLLLAVFVAVVLARQAFGGLGRNVFNPAMAGAAVAQLLLAVPPPAPLPEPRMAAAWAFGLLAMLALRLLRWQAPLGLLSGAALALLAIGGDPACLASSPWLLAAGFVLADSPSGCESARARLLFAFAIAVLTVLASRGGVAALPFAVLAMNALAPALDAALAPRRRAATAP